MTPELAEAGGDEGLVARHGTRGDTGAFVVDLLWLGDRLVATCGDGTVCFAAGPRSAWEPAVVVSAHAGAVLCAAAHPDGASVVTGGDDGRLVQSSPNGESRTLASFGTHWVEHVVAAGEGGEGNVIVCAAGRDACVLIGEDATIGHRFTHPSTIGGLALDGRGKRLAVSHYGGVSLWWVLQPQAAKVDLDWRGSHLAVTFSPDRRFLVTGMQERALHGWRIDNRQSMQMSGYPTKIRSFAWTKKGLWLATSGADRVICWPFAGKTGPMGKAPQELGPGGLLVTRVAAHPGEDAIVAGYEDGSVLLLRLADNKGAVVHAAHGASVSALAWSRAGTAVAFGCEDGRIGILPVAAGRRRQSNIW